MYFLLKVADLLDTVFFVLRKKDRQITFLHLYHHTGMVVLTWAGTKWFPGGHSVFTGFINSIIHVVMYGYYLLTAFSPAHKTNVWWKKYITQMQIVSVSGFGCAFVPWFKMPCCAKTIRNTKPVQKWVMRLHAISIDGART